MASGDTKTQQYLDIAARGTRADLQRGCCNTRTQDLIMDVAERIITEEETRAAADQVLQSEIDEIKNNPDVVDIVPTYAALQNYDTSGLTDKDIIRVLADETHDGASTYYRYSTATGTFTYIGESKQYEDFVGTDGITAGEAGLVPAPATTDAGKYLKADGTWDTVQAGPTVVQTTGTSTTDVMSQNAVSSMVFADPTDKENIRIGGSNVTSSGQATAIGRQTTANKEGAIAISGGTFNTTSATGSFSISIGEGNAVSGKGAVSLGSFAPANSVAGKIEVGATIQGYGYNNSRYRLLTGLYDPQSAHDAATKGYVDGLVGNIASALNAINNGTGA